MPGRKSEPASKNFTVRIPLNAWYAERFFNLPSGERAKVVREALELYFGSADDKLTAIIGKVDSLDRKISQIESGLQDLRTGQQEIERRLVSGVPVVGSVPKEEKPPETKKRVNISQMASFISISSVDPDRTKG